MQSKTVQLWCITRTNNLGPAIQACGCKPARSYVHHQSYGDQPDGYCLEYCNLLTYSCTIAEAGVVTSQVVDYHGVLSQLCVYRESAGLAENEGTLI